MQTGNSDAVGGGYKVCKNYSVKDANCLEDT